MSKKNVGVTILLLMLILMLAAGPMALAAPPLQEDSQQGIVDIAIENGQFTTLVEALEKAELTDTLQGEGPFTVFAPTDEAFAQLPEGTLTDLFGNTEALSDLLMYHVVDGNLMAADLATMDEVETLTGQTLTIEAEEGNVTINGAQVLSTDLAGSNGVIHIIDTVLMPPAMQDDSTGERGTMEDSPAITGTVTMTETTAMTGTVAMTGTEAMTGTTGPAIQAGTTMAEGCAQDYVVQTGDTLGSIASNLLGDSGAYTAIVEATNQAGSGYDPIDDPNLIVVGQTLCVPSSSTAATPAQPGGMISGTGTITGSTTMTATGMMDDSLMADIPESKSKLIFENLSAVDLVFDLSGPTRDSVMIPPGGKQEFVIEPGEYTYNGHQPGGGFSVAPGNFEIAAGKVTAIACYDSSQCQQQQPQAQIQQSRMPSGGSTTPAGTTPGTTTNP